MPEWAIETVCPVFWNRAPLVMRLQRVFIGRFHHGHRQTLRFPFGLGLAACAAGEAVAPVVPVSAAMAEVELARPPVGRKVVERWEDGHEEVWTLVAADDETATWQLEEGGESQYIIPFSTHLRWTGTNVGHSTIEGDAKALYPLRVGQEASWQRTGVNNGNAFSQRIRCTVDGEERVTVAAGAFDTYRVACRSGDDPTRPNHTSTYHFAPEVNQVVKMQRRTADRRNEWGWEVVSIEDPS